jgi:hypothetical protein
MQILLIAILFNALVATALGEDKDRSSAGFFMVDFRSKL